MKEILFFSCAALFAAYDGCRFYRSGKVFHLALFGCSGLCAAYFAKAAFIHFNTPQS